MKRPVIVGVGILSILLSLILFFQLKKIPQILSVSKKPNLTFVFVGDSMTEYLGNFDELQADLNKYYPNKQSFSASKTFLLLNYGFGSTNILSLPDRIEKESTHAGRVFQPINN